MTDGHQITAPDQALSFLLAGKATVTLKSEKSGNHFTYQVKRPRKVKPNGPTHFVHVRVGAELVYLGFIGSTGKFVHGLKSTVQHSQPQSRCFDWSLTKLRSHQLPEQLQVWHEGTCGRCGRPLTHPESIASGIGPECSKKMECT